MEHDDALLHQELRDQESNYCLKLAYCVDKDTDARLLWESATTRPQRPYSDLSIAYIVSSTAALKNANCFSYCAAHKSAQARPSYSMNVLVIIMGELEFFYCTKLFICQNLAMFCLYFSTCGSFTMYVAIAVWLLVYLVKSGQSYSIS